jgi:hypothetical protein
MGFESPNAIRYAPKEVTQQFKSQVYTLAIGLKMTVNYDPRPLICPTYETRDKRQCADDHPWAGSGAPKK